MTKRLGPRAMQRAVDAFNQRAPAGTNVRFWTGLREGEGRVGQVLAPGAFILSGHTPVVMLAGARGCIALSHVSLKL